MGLPDPVFGSREDLDIYSTINQSPGATLYAVTSVFEEGAYEIYIGRGDYHGIVNKRERS